MKFTDLDFLVYSSHKTATQSLVSTLFQNNFKVRHCHYFSNLEFKDDNLKKEFMLDYLIDYKKKNNKKLKIISSLRNPKERLISSFFQTYHSDEIYQKNMNKEETTVIKKNENELIQMINVLIREKQLTGQRESLDEISSVIKKNIINLLEKRENYYYFENNFFELFVLDFNCLIGDDKLNYLNTVLDLNLTKIMSKNLSREKEYYKKYKSVKRKINKSLDKIIERQYDKFYFEAFKDS